MTRSRIRASPSSTRPAFKAQYLDDWATAFDPDVVVYWDVRDERIDVFGDFALVRATNKHTVRRDGDEVTGMTTYTDTYLRKKRKMAVHSSTTNSRCA